MDNRQRTHDTVLTTDSEFISHEKPESPRSEKSRNDFPLLNTASFLFNA